MGSLSLSKTWNKNAHTHLSYKEGLEEMFEDLGFHLSLNT